MISIPPFPLPSNPDKKIRFHAPTVADCLDFSELRPEMEESATTDYLRQLQHGEVSDPELWTAQDRRTALWWIYIAVSQSTTLSYSYECQHCGEVHHVDIDLVDLDDEVRVLNRPPFIDGEISVNDELKPARFHPIDGRGITHMEEKRLELEQADEAGRKRIRAEMRVLEVLHSFSLPEHDALPWSEALERKRDLVHAMDRENEYAPLVAQCLDAARELRHGLAVEITDGRVELVSPPLYCENAQEATGEARPATVLLLRFRPGNFIPEI